MTVSASVLIAAFVPLVVAIVWFVRLEGDVRQLKTDFRRIDGQQRIILRGLVRMGIVTQEEIDDEVDAFAKEGG